MNGLSMQDVEMCIGRLVIANFLKEQQMEAYITQLQEQLQQNEENVKESTVKEAPKSTK